MNKDNTLTFGIADDDRWFRKTLVSTLCFSSDVKAVFCCDNGFELIRKTIKTKPQMILVDLYMPIVSGLEAIIAIRKQSKDVKIIATSSLFQQDVMQELKKYQVNGYCSRSVGDISMALSAILKNDRFFDPAYFDRWIKNEREITEKKDPCNIKLSSTEIDILRYSSEGNTNKEMADKLNLSNRTIDHYLNRLVHKLNLRNKNELVRFSFENGFCAVHCENKAMGVCHTNSIFSAH